MSRFIKISVLAITALFLLCACQNTDSNNHNSDYAYAFTDSTGKEIKLKENPKKVAVLFSSYADIWQLAGGEISITVGESVERGFCGDGILLVDGGAGKTIDNELLISYEPDFVIASADITAQVETANILNKAGIPCALFKTDSFEQYLSMLEICTTITENPDAYQKYGLDIHTEIQRILEKTQGLDSKDVLFIRSGSSASSAKAKTADDHFAAQMLKELGTFNIAENAPVLLDGLSLEEILTENPEHIIITTMGNADAAITYMNSVLSQPTWQALTAVRNGNYFYLPKELFQFKPNAKWADAYRYLAELIYPEINFDE